MTAGYKEYHEADFAEIAAIIPYVKSCPMSKKQAKYFNKIASVCKVDHKKESNQWSPDKSAMRYLKAGEVVPAARVYAASGSMLQRRLKLGYARAARIVDEMEEKGIVGPFQGSKPREILITKEQWATMRGNQPEQMELDDIPFDEGVPEELD
jgi:S-DNA-T family DNA segregation ATPase FtsK/SpoIIIE